MLYNLGCSLPEAAAKLKSRHGYTVSPSTLAQRMSEHRELTTYARLRPQLRHLCPPTKTIHRSKLYIIAPSSLYCAKAHSTDASRRSPIS